MRLLLFIVVALAVLSGEGRTDPVPGSEDENLREAATLWLDETETFRAIDSIREIAATGNIAAQLLANNIYRYHRVLDDFGLSRDDLMSLFQPPDVGIGRFRSRPYDVERSGIEASVAQDRLAENTSRPEQWTQDAIVLLNADLREHFLRQLPVSLPRRELSPEAPLFALEHVALNDRQMADLWFFFLVEIWLFSEVGEHPTDWAIRMWEDEHEAEFLSALANGNWAAFQAFAFSEVIDFDFGFDPDARMVRWAEISNFAYSGPNTGHFPPEEQELRDIGRYLVDPGPIAPYLAPTVGLCELRCAEDVPLCVAHIALGQLEGSFFAATLEPLIPSERYYQSGRAVQELRISVAGSGEPRRAEWWPLPQCLGQPTGLLE